MLEIFCDSLLSFHFFGYKYIGNKYYKVHNGLIFSYTVDHGKKIGGVLKSMLRLNEAIIDVKEG